MKRLRDVHFPETRDLAIGILLFAIVLLMILPVPTPVIDALIGVNFGIAFLLLTTAIYMSNPLSLSSLPGIILISTIFRLSLSISTTRLILTEGDAGAIVESFGTLVVGGNVVVGLVVFFIITVVQFIVIAKGSERIAEVGARFTLDALPGKQMAIDAELRNGDIDNAKAGHRRSQLERESQFFGSMDGAMKFVKGDAIAGLIIILVNLIGGLAIGMAQLGMSLGEASHKYTLLTVGDALISQIPALLVSITAAVIVTRVKAERQLNLGANILSQLASDSRALLTAAAAVGLMGILPGFPARILIPLAALFAGAGLLVLRAERRAGQVIDDASDGPRAESSVPPDGGDNPMHSEPDADECRVVIEMAADLHAATGAEARIAGLSSARALIEALTGIAAPAIAVRIAPDLDDGGFRVTVDEAPHLWSSVATDAVFVVNEPEILQMYEIPFEARSNGLWDTCLVVPSKNVDALAALDLSARSSAEVVFDESARAIAENISLFIGVQEAKEMLGRFEENYPFLVGECARTVPLPRLAEVFRRLLDERVRLVNIRRILEALVEWSQKESDSLALVEFCRIALSQQICASVADENRVITAIVVERDAETILRESIKETGVGTFLTLPEATSAALQREIRTKIAAVSPKGTRPIVLTSMDVRRHLRAFLVRNGIPLDVLSFQELSDDFTVVPTTTIRLKAPPPPARALQHGAEARPQAGARDRADDDVSKGDLRHE